MNLTAQQKRICEQVINVFETGSVQGDYSTISIFPDGPGKIRQVTYGRSQTTEYGNLDELIQMYVDANGTHGNELRPYLEKI
jgi:chitosanase